MPMQTYAECRWNIEIKINRFDAFGRGKSFRSSRTIPFRRRAWRVHTHSPFDIDQDNERPFVQCCTTIIISAQRPLIPIRMDYGWEQGTRRCLLWRECLCLFVPSLLFLLPFPLEEGVDKDLENRESECESLVRKAMK